MVLVSPAGSSHTPPLHAGNNDGREAGSIAGVKGRVAPGVRGGALKAGRGKGVTFRERERHRDTERERSLT